MLKHVETPAQAEAQAVTAGEARQVIALASLGGMLDFYDFVIFGVFSPYLSRHFFPAQDELVSLMKTFGVFAAGYLVRPLGGLVLSHIGDRVGRKRALLISMLLMSLSTLLMGALPDHEHWGVVAPLLFICLRLIQGFSLGGEIPGAITFATEAVPAQRGLACGLIFFCINLGLLGGSVVHEALISVFSQEEIGRWAWRLPFFAGGIFGMISYALRRRLQESRAFSESKDFHPRIPILDLIKGYPRALIGGALISSLGAVLIALCFIYMPTYLGEIVHRDMRQSVRAVNQSLFIFSFLIAIVGFASDRWNRLVIYLFGAIFIGIAAYPLFSRLSVVEAPLPFMMLVIAGVGSFITGTYPPILSEIFPARVRFSGVALAYNLPFATFGGMAPLIATSLIHYSGNNVAPFAYLLGAAALGAAGALLLLRKQSTKS